jgi:hypothetical protein
MGRVCLIGLQRFSIPEQGAAKLTTAVNFPTERLVDFALLISCFAGRNKTQRQRLRTTRRSFASLRRTRRVAEGSVVSVHSPSTSTSAAKPLCRTDQEGGTLPRRQAQKGRQADRQVGRKAGRKDYSGEHSLLQTQNARAGGKACWPHRPDLSQGPAPREHPPACTYRLASSARSSLVRGPPSLYSLESWLLRFGPVSATRSCLKNRGPCKLNRGERLGGN